MFSINQIIEKRSEFNLETHIAFIDFQKAFDSVNRTKLWEILQESGYPPHLIKVVKSLYRDTKVIIETGNFRSDEIATNRGVRQGCGLSPALFNIYLDDVIRKWKAEIHTGITINENCLIGCLLFADDLIILQNSEDDLQRAVYKLSNLCQKYKLRISAQKTKVMAFKGKEPVRSKIVLNNGTLEQLSNFNYLGCDISYRKGKDTINKIHRFQNICGTIHRTLKNNASKSTRLKFYKTIAVPTLLYGCETWVLSKPDESRLQASEMRFLRRTYGCSREDRLRNTEIRKQLNVFSINEKVSESRLKWYEHVSRMSENRIPKLVLDYRPEGRRDRGRPRKRWTDMRFGTGRDA